MDPFDQILGVTEVKKRLLEIMKKISEFGGKTMITKNGKPAGVLIGIDEYEGLLETLDIMSSPETMRKLEQARREIEAGLLIPAEEVWDE